MKVAQKAFSSANELTAEVATTGPMGGDGGHGGETYFKLTDSAGTCWQIEVVDGNGQLHVIEMPKSVKITMLGDAELKTFKRALKWAGKEIKSLAAK